MKLYRNSNSRLVLFPDNVLTGGLGVEHKFRGKVGIRILIRN